MQVKTNGLFNRLLLNRNSKANTFQHIMILKRFSHFFYYWFYSGQWWWPVQWWGDSSADKAVFFNIKCSLEWKLFFLKKMFITTYLGNIKRGSFKYFKTNIIPLISANCSSLSTVFLPKLANYVWTQVCKLCVFSNSPVIHLLSLTFFHTLKFASFLYPKGAISL